MKLLAILSCVLFLGAYQHKESSTVEKKTEESTTTSTEQTTSPTTRESTTTSSEEPKKETVTLNLEAIQSGDYSSLVGRWVAGDSSVFNIDTSGNFSERWTIKIDAARIENGILKASLTDGTYGMAVYIAAEGATFLQGIDGGADASDMTKERIWTGQQPIYSDPNLFYYRDTSSSETSTDTSQKPKSQTSDEAIRRRDTGVWLSGPDSSIEHANKILGEKDRIVSAGTYGKTNEVPYHAVLSSDELVFVYQNGVILSENNDILYEP